MSPLITPTLFTPALAKSAVMYQGEIWTSSHLSIMPTSQVHLTTLVIPIIHTVCVVGGGVRAAVFTLTLFAGGGFHAMRQRLQSELNHLCLSIELNWF